MIIADLGLRPCLIESFPISYKDQIKAINKFEKRIAQGKDLNRRKKRLKKTLDKIKVE